MGGRREGWMHRSAALLPPPFGVKKITMPVTLPCCSRGGGGPSRRGGRDGGRGRGGRGGPLPCRERNPMLVSNSRNFTLAASISPLALRLRRPLCPPLLLLLLGPSILLPLLPRLMGLHQTRFNTSNCCDFPEKLLQEVVTMSMTMMTPPETKKR